MDFALDVLGSRLAEQWEAMMQALWTLLAWTTLLGTLTVALPRLSGLAPRPPAAPLLVSGGRPGRRGAVRRVGAAGLPPAAPGGRV